MIINGSEVKSYTTLNYEFPGIRILDDSLFPTKWKIHANLVASINSKMSKDDVHIQELGNHIYRKLYFWLDTCLPGTIVIDVKNTFGLTVALSSSNLVMYCPGEPTDDMIVRLLHAKLTTLANKHLYIGDMSLESDDMTVSYTFTPEDTGYRLPKKVKDYADLPSLYRIPWWFRNDGFSIELLKPKGCKDKLIEIYKDIEDPLIQFDLMEDDNIEEIPQEPAQIIQVERWTPKIV